MPPTLRLVLSAAVAVMSGTGVLVGQAPLPSIEELRSKLHAPRVGVTQYELVIDARKSEGETKPHVKRMWKDGDKYRTDHLDGFDERGGHRRLLNCTNCPEAGKYFTVGYDPVFDPSKSAVLAPLRNIQEPAGNTSFRFEDLGATNEVIVNLMFRGLKYYTDLEVWTEKRVEQIQWNGLDAYQIVLSAPNHPNRATFAVTLVPTRGYAAVQARGKYTREGAEVVTVSDSDLEQIEGIWLPKSCSYFKTSAGKTIDKSFQAISYARLNRPLDPKSFRLDGMDLIPGTLVGTEKGTLKWDGTQLVAATNVKGLPPGAHEPVSAERQSGSRNLLLWLGGGGLLVISLALARLTLTVARRRAAALSDQSTGRGGEEGIREPGGRQ